MRYSHGGIPEADALHWNAETYQRFGRIIQYLASGHPEHRKTGYIDYHEMHRQFMASEWNDKINDLDIFRAGKNLPSISEIVNKISREIVAYGYTVDAVETSPLIPEFSFSDPTTIKTSIEQVPDTEGMQLSLF